MVCDWIKQPPWSAILGTLCAIAALVAEIVAIGTDHWQEFASDSGSAGIWQICVSSATSCLSLDDGYMSTELKVIRAFAALGTIAIAITVVCGVLLFFYENRNLVPIIAAICAFIAGFSLLTSDGVYANEVRDGATFDSFGYSFGLAVLAMLLSLVAGVCFVVARFCNGKKKVKKPNTTGPEDEAVGRGGAAAKGAPKAK